MRLRMYGSKRRFIAGLLAMVVVLLVIGAGGATASSPSVTMVDLGTLGGRDAQATAVNNFGQVVGNSFTDNAQQHAFSWTEKAGMVDLGTFGGTLTRAEAVNDRGAVVGLSSTAGDTA